jgi:hypothetical protein
LIAEFPKKVKKMEITYLLKLGLTPKRKVAFLLGGSEDFARKENSKCVDSMKAVVKFICFLR